MEEHVFLRTRQISIASARIQLPVDSAKMFCPPTLVIHSLATTAVAVW